MSAPKTTPLKIKRVKLTEKGFAYETFRLNAESAAFIARMNADFPAFAAETEPFRRSPLYLSQIATLKAQASELAAMKAKAADMKAQLAFSESMNAKFIGVVAEPYFSRQP